MSEQKRERGRNVSILRTASTSTILSPLQCAYKYIDSRSVPKLVQIKTEIKEAGWVRFTAKIYWDSEVQECRVRFYKNGRYLSEADYFTDDKEDAKDTAKAELDELARKFRNE